MPCLIVLAVVAFPRVALLVLFFFSTYIERAYDTILLPLVGFLFLPLTTLAYAWMVNSGKPVDGPYLVLLIVAVIFDVGGLGGGEYQRRRR